jgi:hypothetical protein
MSSAEVTAYFAAIDLADAALLAADPATELLYLRSAMILSGKLVTASQEGGNNVDWSSARQGIQARIDRLQSQANATTGVQRQLLRYIRPTS